jgi:hypothetical protein
MLTLYMAKEKEKCPLQGAVIYGMPYNLRENVIQFKTAGMGAFDFLLGYNFYRIIKSKLHEMIPFME